MRSHDVNSGNVGDDSFMAPSRELEMETYDGLPDRLKRALDNATRQFSALQAYYMYTEDDYTVEEVCEIIEKATRVDQRRGHHEED